MPRLQEIAGEMPNIFPGASTTITGTYDAGESENNSIACRKCAFNDRSYNLREELEMNIMIVDDEPQVAEVLAKSLARQGHRTTVVHSGEDALRMIETVTPDALFLDVSMPGVNGLAVLAEVRRTRPQLAVVVITGHATPDEVEEVKRLGAVDVIPKPAALTHYHRAIEKLGTKKSLNVVEEPR
jgi:DNA-binding NtrC family response regulator